MPIKGSAYGSFRRALETRNLTLIRAAAARAGLRWLGPYCLVRRDVTLARVREAVDAFTVLVEEPEAA